MLDLFYYKLVLKGYISTIKDFFLGDANDCYCKGCWNPKHQPKINIMGLVDAYIGVAIGLNIFDQLEEAIPTNQKECDFK